MSTRPIVVAGSVGLIRRPAASTPAMRRAGIADTSGSAISIRRARSGGTRSAAFGGRRDSWGSPNAKVVVFFS